MAFDQFVLELLSILLPLLSLPLFTAYPFPLLPPSSPPLLPSPISSLSPRLQAERDKQSELRGHPKLDKTMAATIIQKVCVLRFASHSTRLYSVARVVSGVLAELLMFAFVLCVVAPGC